MTRPMAAAISIATRQPHSPAAKMMMGGAITRPEWPANMLMPNERPMNFGGMEAIRMV